MKTYASLFEMHVDINDLKKCQYEECNSRSSFACAEHEVADCCYAQELQHCKVASVFSSIFHRHLLLYGQRIIRCTGLIKRKNMTAMSIPLAPTPAKMSGGSRDS